MKHRYFIDDKYLLGFYLFKSLPEGLLLYTPAAYVAGSVEDHFYVGPNEFRTTCHTIDRVQAWLLVALMLETGLICIAAAFKYGTVT